MYYFLLALGLFVVEIVYFRLADRFNIIDKPNERSSHTQITLRGGGIVFLVAGLVYAIYTNFAIPWFWVGFLIIAVLSFADDVLTLSSRLRLPLQSLAVMLLIYQVLQGNSVWWVWLVALILVTGIINAYNFMDGVNGITAGYSFVVLCALAWLNHEIKFAPPEMIGIFLIADLVFAFFNFRKKARCFAGDVGSVSIAFVIVYLLFALIMATQNVFFILLLGVYGVDSVLTIIYRLRKRENIFEAHRSHLYQWLVNPGPFSHLQMSSIYMAVQGLIAVLVIWAYKLSAFKQLLAAAGVLIVLGLIYIIIKSKYKKRFGLV